MRSIFLAFYFVVFGLSTLAQSSWKTKFVFEYLRDDTSNIRIYDTIYIGLDTLGGLGYQAGLDEYVDSFPDNRAIISDSLFKQQYPNKFLKKSIQKFQLKGPKNVFKVVSKGNLIAIGWDSVGYEFKGSKYITSLKLEASGVSLGGWDNNTITYVWESEIWKNSKWISVIEAPYYFGFTLNFWCFDTILLGFPKIEEENYKIYLTINNELVIKSQNYITEMKITVYDLKGNTLEKYVENNFDDTSISWSHLMSGMYLLKIEIDDNSVSFNKFIKL